MMLAQCAGWVCYSVHTSENASRSSDAGASLPLSGSPKAGKIPERRAAGARKGASKSCRYVSPLATGPLAGMLRESRGNNGLRKYSGGLRATSPPIAGRDRPNSYARGKGRKPLPRRVHTHTGKVISRPSPQKTGVLHATATTPGGYPAHPRSIQTPLCRWFQRRGCQRTRRAG